ncbi:MAG: ABC transporter ATP-binding protein [Anaeromyxobacter sp.]|nr:ABC transporter ATP-binding protein [Anaeromyxobacter sp.]MBL0278271.1 ABC transporter ATP-binding protein [Anaeromyxobacter sp.]
MLRVRNLDVAYGQRLALRHVSLHVDPGEIVSLIGANGAGKTTLLRTVAGLGRGRAGEVLFDGRDVTRLPPEQVVMLGCSLVPEGRQVFATMPVRENLLLGATVQYRRGRHREVEEDLRRAYRLFPRLEQRAAQLAGTLSGGEQQMLAMARALMARPRLVMLDEPSMGLAPLVVKDLFQAIRTIRDEGATVLLVEQNARGALRLSDRGYVLETGRIVLTGSAAALLQNRDVQRAYLGGEPSAAREGEERR